MARLDPNPYPLPPFDIRGDWRQSPHVKAMDELLEASHKLPPGKVKGAVVKWQRADGYAWYIVTSERPLTLQHIDYMDGYAVEPALIRGLTKADIEEMLERERRWRAASG